MVYSPHDFNYCMTLVRARARDHFLRGLFVPKPWRETVYALYALDAELAHIPHVVKEEVLAQMRYFWWQEAIQDIAAGKAPRVQPVLQALTFALQSGHIDSAPLVALVEAHGAHYPATPPDSDVRLESLVTAFIEKNCRQALAGWKKAGNIIGEHRTRYGNRKNSRLTLRLLFAK